ncbi:MAG: hypothetical protein AAGA48_23820 [Myxococcota bacterium]
MAVDETQRSSSGGLGCFAQIGAAIALVVAPAARLCDDAARFAGSGDEAARGFTSFGRHADEAPGVASLRVADDPAVQNGVIDGAELAGRALQHTPDAIERFKLIVDFDADDEAPDDERADLARSAVQAFYTAHTGHAPFHTTRAVPGLAEAVQFNLVAIDDASRSALLAPHPEARNILEETTGVTTIVRAMTPEWWFVALYDVDDIKLREVFNAAP